MKNNKVRLLLVACPTQIMGMTKIALLPNLGIVSIAGNINNEICEAKVVDLNIIRHNYSDYYINLLSEYKPDVVGISAMIFQENDVSELAKITKKTNPKILTVIGGYHGSTTFETLLEDDRFSEVDFIMRREAEQSFSKFIETLYTKADFHEVPNLTFRENGKIVHTHNGSMINLDQLKLPDRDSRLFKDGFHVFGRRADLVETTRGCVNNCNYCSITQMYDKCHRKYKIERVIEDLKISIANGTKFIIFADDNITLDPKRFFKLCHAIIENNCNKIEYAIQSSITIFAKHPEIIPLMKKAGITTIYIGLESGDKKTLEFLSKDNIYKEIDTKRVLKEMRKNGLNVAAAMIIGHPDDTEETILANLYYVNNVDVTLPFFLVLTPFPKTGIRDTLEELNLITNPYDYSKYDFLHVNVRTKYLSSHKIHELREYLAFQLLKRPIRLYYIIKLMRFFFFKMIFKSFLVDPLDTIGYFISSLNPMGRLKSKN